MYINEIIVSMVFLVHKIYGKNLRLNEITFKAELIIITKKY